MKTFCTIVYVFLFSAFAKAQDSAPVSVTSPVIAFKIPIGETVSLKGQNIRFESVLEDSRCPKNVQCIWQGEVTFKVHLSGNVNKDIVTTLQSPQSPIIFENADYLIKVVTLSPYPNSTVGSDPENYELLLKVKEK